ncbi:MAG: efflux RND transporter permease subunit [Pirellulaceae bacterium]
MDSFANFLDRRRVGLAVVLVVFSGICAIGIGRLGFEDQPRGIFRTEDDSFQELERVFQQFGTDELNCMLLVENEDLFVPRSIQALHELVENLDRVAGVEEIIGIADARLLVATPWPHRLLPAGEITLEQARQVRREAVAHPLVAGRLLTTDGRRTLMIVRLAGNELTIQDLQPMVRDIRTVMDQVNRESVLKVRMTGLPSIRVDVFTAIQQDYQNLLWLGAAMAFTMAMLIFRQFTPALVIFLASITGVLWIVGVMGLVGEKITVITTVLPTLVGVIGLTDAIHMMFEFRHQRRVGRSAREASTNTIRYLGIACGLTSLTTAIGFSSLATSHLEIIARFGIACAVGALMVFASVMTLVPLLCGTGLVKAQPARLTGKGVGPWTRIAEPLIELVLRRRWLITIMGILVAVCLSGFAMRIQPDSHLAENMPADSESAHVLQDVDRYFGGIMTMSVVLQWPAQLEWNAPEVRAALDEVHAAMAVVPELKYPTSIRNFVDLLPVPRLEFIPASVRGSWIRTDLNRMLVTARLQDRGIAYQTEMLRQLQQRLRELNAQPGLQGFKLLLTGSSVVAAENISQMLTDLGQSLGLATIVIFIVLVIVYRSLRIGLICLLPNILPLLITATVIVVSGEPLQLASVLVFTVCLGIAVDDTIHFISRFRRELAVDQDVDAALRRTFVAVGAALLTSTLILLVGFCSALASDLPHIRMFVSLSCVAIFSALLGDLLILPAMLACFYRAGTRSSAREAVAGMSED